ncbi:MAG: hypothetical protein H7A40_03965 [Chlamydiales bacterium]|nr:hypothetical protein [Chlamydiales bacterium]
MSGNCQINSLDRAKNLYRQVIGSDALLPVVDSVALSAIAGVHYAYLKGGLKIWPALGSSLVIFGLSMLFLYAHHCEKKRVSLLETILETINDSRWDPPA